MSAWPGEPGGRATRRRRRLEKAAARALARSPVELCRRLHWTGFEALQGGELPPIVLPSPLGSPEVARRAAEMFLPEAIVESLDPAVGPVADDTTLTLEFFGRPLVCRNAPARRAVAEGRSVAWLAAWPVKRHDWRIEVREPIEPRPDEDPAALTARFLEALEEEARRRPEAWGREV